MAKQNNKEPKKSMAQGINQTSIMKLPTQCSAQACQTKIDRLVFCKTHFGWYKEGLLNKHGRKPKDFDKKYQDYLNRHNQAA